MTKLIALILSFLLFAQSMNIGINDIILVDELFEHAQFHKAKYGDNFLVFLSKHYGEQKLEHSEKHQEEHQDHEKLPFQQQTQSTLISVLVINDSVPIDWSISSSDKVENYHYQPPSSSPFKSGIFQPPKVA
ncbi:hypothetical protein [Spongiivirga citrea]|uniref:Uncharacterized protein n=1 Tax=Spongiivirga citrea TaxID=1481457 RepID=A0A6M0CM69_9FLAO|nr:hypothetical protein [Spongiivirga citrea]NER19046.1 hypothetical protein [Spongiivirga citrea]